MYAVAHELLPGTEDFDFAGLHRMFARDCDLPDRGLIAVAEHRSLGADAFEPDRAEQLRSEILDRFDMLCRNDVDIDPDEPPGAQPSTLCTRVTRTLGGSGLDRARPRIPALGHRGLAVDSDWLISVGDQPPVLTGQNRCGWGRLTTVDGQLRVRRGEDRSGPDRLVGWQRPPGDRTQFIQERSAPL